MPNEENVNTHVFNVGDEVIALSNTPYCVTTDGWTGIVTEIRRQTFCAQGSGGYDHTGYFYYLEPIHFRLRRRASEIAQAREAREVLGVDIAQETPVVSRIVVQSIGTTEEVEDRAEYECADCGDIISSDDTHYNNYDDNCRCYMCNSEYVSNQTIDDDDEGSIPCRSYGNKFVCKYKYNLATNIIQSPRGFGVEIEAYGKSYGAIETISGTMHSEIGISGDGSLNRKGFELQFPLTNGRHAEKMVYDTCNILKENNTRIDNTCGYHLHLECLACEQSFSYIQRLMFVATVFDDIIMSFLPRDRRLNRYCQSLLGYVSIDRVLNSETKKDLERLWYRESEQTIRRVKQQKYSDKRYYGFNFHAYLSKMKHLEIRHHTGTINAEKILQWANMHTLLLDAVHREIKREPMIKNWDMKQSFVNLYDEGYGNIDGYKSFKDKNKLQKKTDIFFDFIGLSDKSRKYFIARQNKFNFNI